MKRALTLAWQADPAPNPRVGALVVQGDKILGQGYHVAPGTPHAEVVALKEAGEGSLGADLYVTLEPCCHTSPQKRTPPCVPQIIQAGIRRVIVASRDPNPSVAGQGIQFLREAGLEVIEGVLSDEEQDLNREYHHWHKTGLPWVHLKQAITLDGKITRKEGTQTLLSCQEGIKEGHRLRARHQGILIGAGTLRIDNPRLTLRNVSGPSPVRIILEGQTPVKETHRVFQDQQAPTILLTQGGRAPVIQVLKEQGVQVIILSDKSLTGALRTLGAKGIVSLLVEGGQGLASALIQDNLINEISLLVSPQIWGQGLSMTHGMAPLDLRQGWKTSPPRQIGHDLHLHWVKEGV